MAGLFAPADFSRRKRVVRSTFFSVVPTGAGTPLSHDLNTHGGDAASTKVPFRFPAMSENLRLNR